MNVRVKLFSESKLIVVTGLYRCTSWVKINCKFGQVNLLSAEGWWRHVTSSSQQADGRAPLIGRISDSNELILIMFVANCFWILLD